MAEDITFVHFRYGTYAEINNSANNRTLNPHAVYIATDKQLMYAKGAWIGVTSVTSEVNQDTGEITLKFNYDSEGQPTGNPITCSIKGAGMTTEQKAQLETAYNFAINIGGTSADDVINKWQEVVDFLAGIEGGTLEGIVDTKADKNTTITAGDGLTGGGDLSENRTINVVSENDGITVNSDNIQLNTVDNLTTSSTTKPLSANQGKVLDGKVKSITDLVNDMFEKVTDNGKTYIKTKYGFASDEFVSAGGTDDTESGGGGGANLTQMWESLQNNNDTFKDILINVAHIPTLTTGKISDFVSATQAIADTAVANKADKATTLEGYGITDAFTWKRNITSTTTDDNALWGEIGIQTYGEVLPDGLTGQYNYGVLASFNDNKDTGSQFQLYASDSRTILPYNRHIAWRSGFGENKGRWRKLANIDTENIFTESQTFQKQIKSTIATGTAPFSVASTTLVTNLNADMLDGLHGSEYAKMVNLANYLPLTGGTLTGALKIVDANLSYDLGTLIVDKSLKAIGTMSATQGEFANYIKIGNATISWNARGGYLEINEGLASQKFISAGGVVTGNAGGGSGGLSLADMWISLNGNIDAYGKSKIHIDHIPLDAILSHDDYENDVADRINTFNYRNSSSFTSAVKALIVADNIPTLEMSKIEGLEDTLTDIGTVVQSNYETLNTLITNNHKDHEARIKAIEQALTWQTV